MLPPGSHSPGIAVIRALFFFLSSVFEIIFGCPRGAAIFIKRV
jgi:hypothetical protein